MIGEGDDACCAGQDTRRRSSRPRPRRRSVDAGALARALMQRARVVEIDRAETSRACREITLRRMEVVVSTDRQALGKIIGYSLALDGSDGRISTRLASAA